MTDWQSPAVVAANFSALVKLVHAMGGVLIWDFVSNLDFDISFFTGKRKLLSSYWIYMGARWCPLFAVITLLIGFNAKREINCEVRLRLPCSDEKETEPPSRHGLYLSMYEGFLLQRRHLESFVTIQAFAYLSFVFASALIVLRIAAIWERNKVAIALASVAWLTNAGSYIHSTATVRAGWTGNTCAVLNTSESKINIMKGGVWWLLYTQGLAWIVVVTLAEVPAAVFIVLNLNGAMNLMFQVPELIIMALGASRIYRALVDFVHQNRYVPSTDVGFNGGSNEPTVGRFVARAGQTYRTGTTLTAGTDRQVFVMDSLNSPVYSTGHGHDKMTKIGADDMA
ncbi:hypothetical protein B0F90DRAFT_1820274 [Multifurca ochricompacta]|uniref:Uncharacterized protein n=1 Tax=Multifurca ochricompacta TaxID=376703 RepID=A0AAD4LZ40_9AGAM|nr:hypothetical protein B0F90DRAFT_1820274 [Multifurca ochricompacta]